MEPPARVQREQISRRSAAGVMTEKSGSPPHSGQLPCGHPWKSVRAHDRVGAARQERPHRLQQQRLEPGDLRPRPRGRRRALGARLRTSSGSPRAAARRRGSARRRAGSPPARSPRASASTSAVDRTRNRRSLQSIGTCSNARMGVPADSALSRCAVSRFIAGSGTRDCTRRCSWISWICRSMAEARSGCSSFSCRSSRTSRGSVRVGAGLSGGLSTELILVNAGTVKRAARDEPPSPIFNLAVANRQSRTSTVRRCGSDGASGCAPGVSNGSGKSTRPAASTDVVRVTTFVDRRRGWRRSRCRSRRRSGCCRSR